MGFRPLILCYHAVSEDWGDRLAVRPDALRRHVGWLMRRGLRPIDAAHLLDDRPRTFHVTFDDAFRSIVAVVPGLLALGVPVTVFVCTALARDGDPLVIPELHGRADGLSDELLTLSWDALGELARDGVTVGSHTVSHPHLPDLDDVDLRRELKESRTEIEDRLRRPCRLVAYPYGDEDRRVRHAAGAAGYAAGLALLGDRRRVDPFALPRVDLYRRDGTVRAALKTSGAARRLAPLRERAGQNGRSRNRTPL